jgi:septal ring factor EnvC (AmiA/AmiB activator)
LFEFNVFKSCKLLLTFVFVQARARLAKRTEELDEMVAMLDVRLHEEEIRMEALEAEKKKLQTVVQDLEDQLVNLL